MLYFNLFCILFLAFDGKYLWILVPQVKGQLQIGEEIVCELWIHVQNLQQLFSLDGVQVAVAERSDVCIRFPRLSVQVDHLSKYIILAWRTKDTFRLGIYFYLHICVTEDVSHCASLEIYLYACGSMCLHGISDVDCVFISVFWASKVSLGQNACGLSAHALSAGIINRMMSGICCFILPSTSRWITTVCSFAFL